MRLLNQALKKIIVVQEMPPHDVVHEHDGLPYEPLTAPVAAHMVILA